MCNRPTAQTKDFRLSSVSLHVAERLQRRLFDVEDIDW